VSQRFQIEDLVEQGTSGVIFRALDTETHQHVALRRLLPFGPNGGGLREDEQNAYNAVIQQLTRISHPAFRSVISGGCDAVDGQPYIATEWIAGTPLRSFIRHRHLTLAEAIQLLTHALEICEQISQCLNEEAVWLETDLHTIIIGDEATGRGMTFWIAPLRWLAKNDHDRSLNSIIGLTEQLMGWEGKTPASKSGNGLGRWLEWLRDHVKTATLREAREMLVALNSTESIAPSRGPAPPTPRPVISAKKPIVKPKKKKSSNPLVAFFATLAVVAVGLGGWMSLRDHFPPRVKPSEIPATAITKIPKKNHHSPPAGKTELPATAPVAIILDIPPTRRALDLTAATQEAVAANEAKVALQNIEIAKRNGVFTPEDRELLVAQNHQHVTVEGVFQSIDYSGSRKTMYLLFTPINDSNSVRGKVRVKGADEDLSELQLSHLIGKKIRLKGEIQVERIAGLARPVIVVESRSAIQALE
jgi:hypothetical protein